MSFKKYKNRSAFSRPADPSTLNHTQRNDQARHQRNVRRNRTYVYDEIKRRGGCEFCGLVDDPKVYQWHHIDDEDPTKKTVAFVASSHTSLKNVRRELDKCVLLCPNCHTKFHQDLLCMLDHKQQHIDGTFYDTKCKEEEEEKTVEEVKNSLLKFT